MILLALFLLLLIFNPITSHTALASQVRDSEIVMPWSTIGAGGAHLLVKPGPLEIRIYKKDLDSSRTSRTEMKALLLGPDRTVLETVTIPAYEDQTSDGQNRIQSATLRTEVKHPGIFLLHLLFPGNRHGICGMVDGNQRCRLGFGNSPGTPG